ncbi:MAG: NAD(P)/FAD-dependent oxidoreductase [Streptosporangiaceae bacterium]
MPGQVNDRVAPAQQPGTAVDGGAQRRLAVVGSGVAGLTAAYVLSRTAQVTLFEADSRLGGHADTHRITGPDGRELAVDTGFIVHNARTYPLLTRLFAELGVTTQKSEMSMSVSCTGCGLEYAGQRGLAGLAAGLPRGRGDYARMLGEVLRFHRAARRLLASPPQAESGGGELTFGQFLASGGYSAYFRTHFALPFVAAVWSCAPQTALSHPARHLFTFLSQHGLLTVTGSPPWLTVTGGSASYVDRVAKQLTAVRTGARVQAVRREAGSVRLRYTDPDGGGAETFDGAVIATHPGQALAMLAEPTPAEQAVLGAFRYSANPTILHTDDRLLPRSRAARASWNYTLPSCSAMAGQVQVSYWMNRLQRLPGNVNYLVTLNSAGCVDASRVLARMDYEHPICDPGSVAAQGRLPGLNDGVLAYAGAYHGWGFHEDGCRAGVAAAASLGGRW